jgi:hypothetical protein
MRDHYDVLITSASWEARSTAVLNYFEDTEFAQAYVFRYAHKRPRNAEIAEQQYHSILTTRLASRCEQVTSLQGLLWEPLQGLRSLVADMRRSLGTEAGLRILFDVSTFTKAYVLVFLRYLDDDALRNRLTLFYTDLAQPQEGRPSEGVRKVIALPFYGGEYTPGKDTLLITFLGSEPERVTALWEHVAPQLTIPLFSYRRDRHNPLGSQILKDQFLARPGVHTPLEVDGSNPLKIAASLSTLYAQHRGRYNIVLGAVGSKVQAVGVYIFCKLQAAMPEVFYPVASRYHIEYWNPTVVGPSMLIELSNNYSIKQLASEPEPMVV